MSEVCRWRLMALFGASIASGCRDAAAPSQEFAREASALVSQEAFSGVTYSAQDLGVLPGMTQSEGRGINKFGDVAGGSWDPSIGPIAPGHAVIWVGNTAVDLGVPPGTLFSWAYDVNDERTVVGYSFDGVDARGFLWKSGTFRLIPAAGPSPQTIVPFAVNNRNVAVGQYYTGTVYHAFRYSVAGGFVDLHPPGYVESGAKGISDNGVVVGWAQLAPGETHAAAWSATSVFTDLGALGTRVWATGYDVNKSGVIVGESNDAQNNSLPFVWRSGTGIVGITGPEGSAYGISDANRIVGIYPNEAWTRKGNGPVVALPLPQGSTAGAAYAVNRCGNVAGIASTTGIAHAVRWTISQCDP